jgi:uncharacterized OB-fold protein
MSGRGQVASFIIIHHPPIPWLEMPIVVGLVELEEGPRIASNICEIPPDMVELGMQVEVFFEPTVDATLGVPLFRPAAVRG